MLVDSHCHLNYPEFADLPAVLARAAAAGVGLFQTIGCKRADFETVLELTRRDPRIYCSIGVHPHEAESHQDLTLEELLGHAAHPKVIGLGETGLDFFYEHSPRDIQERLFRMHIEASRRSGLPVIIHTRDADADTIRILEDEMRAGAFTGLIHCFSTGRELAEKAIELGLLISISGIVTFKKAQALQEVVRDLPLGSLLVETDSPYLAPEPHRGRKNEPAFTALVAQKIAALKQIPIEEVQQITTRNFLGLFPKAQFPHPSGEGALCA